MFTPTPIGTLPDDHVLSVVAGQDDGGVPVPAEHPYRDALLSTPPHVRTYLLYLEGQIAEVHGRVFGNH